MIPIRDHEKLAPLRREYLLAILDVHRPYSLETTRNETNDAGEIVEAQRKLHFQVVGIQHGRKRRKLMHTAFSADGVPRCSPLSIQIQEMDKPVGCFDFVEAPADEQSVFCDVGDPYWVSPFQLGDWCNWRERCQTFDCIQGCAAYPGAIVLSHARAAVPMCAITDKAAPTLMVVCGAISK